ncbi:methyltransferase domain-containing protein [Hyphococcus flavus]|uniref:Methyltransferase domain-containing protein n=1 Tax=Hyphococcus flavus TaxID=1866326 RepID=A0AAE9ZHU3_9PROT|nr:methyltransferase domain-containing protein [Hyphococcus flavus]WDI30495.1 methyltransferase domain-containing protein [Hyphococcus flavus]
MTAPPAIFNRRVYAQRRDRAAKNFAAHAFLHERAFDDIIDRLETVKRDFPNALFMGAGDLPQKMSPACGVGKIFNTDIAGNRVALCDLSFVADDEALPVAPRTMNLIVSLLTLHMVNDVVGALTQARMALKPDGLFVAATFGEETLSTLRQALYKAEAEVTGGVSARIAPFATIQDYGQALGRAGFALPVVDIDKVRVNYSDPFKLLQDIRGMGETSVLRQGARPLRRDVLMKAMDLFLENGGSEKFDIVYLTGWAPHASQQKPLKPGAGKSSLEDAVKGLG